MSDPFLNFPYRRFSSDIYSAQLAELLDANEIPFEVISEPDGAGSVFLGASTIPGVIIMVNPADVQRIVDLEKQLTPQKHAEPKIPEAEESVEGYWFVIGYILALSTSPIAIIIGLHLFTAKRRTRDFGSMFAYNEQARYHGRMIFWFALFIFVFSIGRVIVDGKGSLLDTVSFAAWAISEAIH